MKSVLINPVSPCQEDDLYVFPLTLQSSWRTASFMTPLVQTLLGPYSIQGSIFYLFAWRVILQVYLALLLRRTCVWSLRLKFQSLLHISSVLLLIFFSRQDFTMSPNTMAWSSLCSWDYIILLPPLSVVITRVLCAPCSSSGSQVKFPTSSHPCQFEKRLGGNH